MKIRGVIVAGPEVIEACFSTKEALIKSPRAIGERFCSKLRFGKRRNTLCISSFSNQKVGTKDSLSADGYLFRVSLVIQQHFKRNATPFPLLYRRGEIVCHQFF